MGVFYLKFKRRLNSIRLARALMSGFATAFLISGIWLLLSKLTVIDFEPITALYVGTGGLVLVGLFVFLICGKSDKRFAKELDKKFGLKARVQTMIACRDEEGAMVLMQREDTESALSKIKISEYKFKGFWIHIVALALSVTVLAVAFISENKRDVVIPEVKEPFKLSALQKSELEALINRIEGSDMEEEFRIPMAECVRKLLLDLQKIETEEEMLVLVDSCMGDVQRITYDSSTSTEILNALWDSGDTYLRHLAKALYISDSDSLEWEDFVDDFQEYKNVLLGAVGEDNPGSKENLKFAVDTVSRKLARELENSGVPSDDEIYFAITDMFERTPGGLTAMLNVIDWMSEEEARNYLDSCLNQSGKELHSAVVLNKKNSNTGEMVMTRLASLFKVDLPMFERPEFVKNGETVGSDNGNDEDDSKDNANSGGGIGTGATFGSDDIVLDPITGKLTTYGELYSKYYAEMYEKLDSNLYTEEQKKIIKKYFDLLYSGIDKKEGQ